VNVLLGEVAQVSTVGHLPAAHLHAPVFHHLRVDQAPDKLVACSAEKLDLPDCQHSDLLLLTKNKFLMINGNNLIRILLRF